MIELLDDLREVIWARYQLQLQEWLREQHCTEDEPESVNISDTDPMF